MNSQVLTVRESQLAALSILKTIDKICNNEGLRYYLVYGSLIGAVRHQGFIPWDDDLDIAMPRQDYDTLLSFFAKHADEMLPLVAVHNTSNRMLPFLITRISDTTYRMIGENGEVIPELGAFVDIYPMDGLGMDLKTAVRIKHRCFRLASSYIRALNSPVNNKGMSPARKIAKSLLQRLLRSPKYYYSLILSVSTKYKYDESEYVSNVMWTDKELVDYVYHNADFGEGILVEFEDMRVRIPVGYDSILKSEYGDYMQLPPISDRQGHHCYQLVWR